LRWCSSRYRIESLIPNVSTAAGYDSGGQWLVAAAADLRSRRERRIEGRGIQID
jgi:hypothetical protein